MPVVATQRTPLPNDRRSRQAGDFVTHAVRPQIERWERELGVARAPLEAMRDMWSTDAAVIAPLAAALGRCGSLGALLAGLTAWHADALAEVCGLRPAAPGPLTLAAAAATSVAFDQGVCRLSASLPDVVNAEHSGSALVRIADSDFALIDLASPGVEIIATPDVGCHAAGLARIQLESVSFAQTELARPSLERVAALDTQARLLSVRGLCTWSQTLLDDTFDFVSSRRFAGSGLIDQQVIRHRLADIIARQKLLEAQHARAERGAPAERTLAALFASEVMAGTLPPLVKECQQLFGGRGFLTEYPVSRAYRDSLCLASLLGPAHERHADIARHLAPDWRVED